MKAKVASPCSVCGRMIQPGEEITGLHGDAPQRTRRQRRVWIHQDCARPLGDQLRTC